MKNQIQIFSNPTLGEVRVSVTADNEPLFCAADVCKALGYTNSRKAVADHTDDGDVTKRDTPTTSGIQTMAFVNESGLYSLIFGSKLDSAKAFKKWVTSEVLPAIRKSGGYMTASEQESPEMIMARALRIANETIERNKQRVHQLESENEAQKRELAAAAPKVSYYDETLQSVNTLTTTQIAKELGLDARKLNRKMKEAGVIFRQSGMWMLREPYSSWNMASTRTQTYTRSDGSTGTSVYTVWNERGRRFIHALHECGYKPKAAAKAVAGKGGAR